MPICPQDTLQVPTVLFKYLYHITHGFDEGQQIGRGGSSDVFKARTSKSNKVIAIKKLKDSDDVRSLMNFEGMMK